MDRNDTMVITSALLDERTITDTNSPLMTGSLVAVEHRRAESSAVTRSRSPPRASRPAGGNRRPATCGVQHHQSANRAPPTLSRANWQGKSAGQKVCVFGGDARAHPSGAPEYPTLEISSGWVWVLGPGEGLASIILPLGG
jgi:hypothetical protein